LLFSLSVYFVYSEPQCVCHPGGAVAPQYNAAAHVFRARILSIQGTTANVELLESYKGRKVCGTADGKCSVNVHTDCGVFPVEVNEEGIFFTSKFLGMDTNMQTCKQNLNEDVIQRLRSGDFTCPDMDAVHKPGDYWNQGCLLCNCFDGTVSCNNIACREDTNPPQTNPPQDQKYCLAADGKSVFQEGESVYDSRLCQTCMCQQGVFECSPPGINCDSRGVPIKGLGISLTTVIVILFLGLVVVILIRRKMTQKREQDVVLEDVDDNSVNGTPGAYVPVPSVYPSADGATFAYSSPHVWGQAPCTSTVMMVSQTGEPVVAQVAYV